MRDDEIAALGSFPALPSLRQLAYSMRGAIWPKLGLTELPYGPRPGDPSNIAMMDYIEVFTPAQQDMMMRAYVNCGRHYTMTTMGPIIDLGYHGKIPATDLSYWPAYLDAAEKWWLDYRIPAIHFLRPDAGVQGLAWGVDDLNRVLRPLFETPRAQRIMRVVCLAWEPGGRYGYNNSWWVEMVQWMAEVFPNALRCIHTPPDEDAPVGADDDGHPDLAAWAWGNLAPYLHCWLVQNAGYTDTGNSTPSADFMREFLKQWNVMEPSSLWNRFQRGYNGWPTSSAWGPDFGILPIPFEFWAFGGFWDNYHSADAHVLTDAALSVGAIGSMDDGGNS